MVEREVLSKINYPLILSLYYSFQDERYLYMVIELCRRGSLKDVIEEHFQNTHQSLSSQVIQFYTMEMILALQKLHNTYDVVHRDFKPENVLISSTGHIRISDFGTALVNQRAKSYRHINYSFCGTAQYVSPELLKDEPIGPACDLWALGCIIYQLYYGKSPFYAENEYLIFDKILQYDDNNKTNLFPSDNIPPHPLQDLILSLLRIDPFQRLGSSEENSANSFDLLLYHQYFSEYNPSTIINTEPPLYPLETITSTISKDSIDNIDEDYSLEENAVPVQLHLLDLTSSSSSSSTSTSTSSKSVEDSPSGKSPLIFSSADNSPLLKPIPLPSSSSQSIKPISHSHTSSFPSIPKDNSISIPTSSTAPTSTSNSIRKHVKRGMKRRTPQTTGSDDDDENNNIENKQWKVFLNTDEMIVLNSAIWKKKTFRTVKRQLILTDHPRIIVIDPLKMVITKIITFEVPLIVTMKSSRAFDLKTRTRLYHYTDCYGHPEKWKNAIDAMNVQIFNR